MELKKEYKSIAKDILNNEKFLELKKDRHHGTNKYDHCKRVSYLSYLLAKLFHADVNSSVRAGLLHDFFFGERTAKAENSYLKHPNTSAKNAIKYFNISDNEADIIRTHMFHHVIVKKILPFVNFKEKAKVKDYVPKSREGHIVCISDLLVSVFEFSKYQVNYQVYLYMLFLINWLTTY